MNSYKKRIHSKRMNSFERMTSFHKETKIFFFHLNFFPTTGCEVTRTMHNSNNNIPFTQCRSAPPPPAPGMEMQRPGRQQVVINPNSRIDTPSTARKKVKTRLKNHNKYFNTLKYRIINIL